jgi:hypothetical protein
MGKGYKIILGISWKGSVFNLTPPSPQERELYREFFSISRFTQCRFYFSGLRFLLLFGTINPNDILLTFPTKKPVCISSLALKLTYASFQNHPAVARLMIFFSFI